MQASGKAGISLHSQLFSVEAGRHQRAAAIWLGVVCLVIVLTVAFALFGFQISIGPLQAPPANAAPFAITQYVLPRIFIVSILTYGLIFSVRNYNSSRHNFIVNRHRQIALNSFQTFVSSTDNEQVKDAVLMQATQSIFALGISGYIQNEPEPDAASKIIEIVKNVSSSK
jgi:hypothetical protein